MTGKVKFDPEGFRTDFTVGIIELTEKGIVNVGKWNSNSFDDGILIERVYEVHSDDKPNSLKNKTFTMVIALVRTHLRTVTQTCLQNTYIYLLRTEKFLRCFGDILFCIRYVLACYEYSCLN